MIEETGGHDETKTLYRHTIDPEADEPVKQTTELGTFEWDLVASKLVDGERLLLVTEKLESVGEATFDTRQKLKLRTYHLSEGAGVNKVWLERVSDSEAAVYDLAWTSSGTAVIVGSAENKFRDEKFDGEYRGFITTIN
jgi:hypothetical protein